MEGLSDSVIEEFGTFDITLKVGSPLLDKCKFGKEWRERESVVGFIWNSGLKQHCLYLSSVQC